MTYKVDLKDGSQLEIHNPADLPDANAVEAIREPIVKLEIICPNESIGDLIKLRDAAAGSSGTRRFFRKNAPSFTTKCRWPKSSSISTTS